LDDEVVRAQATRRLGEDGRLEAEVRHVSRMDRADADAGYDTADFVAALPTLGASPRT